MSLLLCLFYLANVLHVADGTRKKQGDAAAVFVPSEEKGEVEEMSDEALCKLKLKNLCEGKICHETRQCWVAGKCTDYCGQCPPSTFEPKNGMMCDDGNPRTMNDVCRNGKCVGTPVSRSRRTRSSKHIDWCYAKCPEHSSCRRRTYYRRAWHATSRGYDGYGYWYPYTGFACSCHPGFYGSTSGRDGVSGIGWNKGGHGSTYAFPQFDGQCYECAVGETSSYWSNACTQCSPGTYAEIPRTANGGPQGPGRSVWKESWMHKGCVDCWPGYFSASSGASACDECVAGRTSSSRSAQCKCRTAGSCSRKIPELDGSYRHLSGSNCVSTQAQRCTKEHLVENFLLQRHDAPSIFLEAEGRFKLRASGVVRGLATVMNLGSYDASKSKRPSSRVFDLDCIATLRSFVMSVQLFDAESEIETDATIEVAFLDAAGIELKRLSHTNHSALLNPDLEHERGRLGCDDAGDGSPNNRVRPSYAEDGSDPNHQPCVEIEKWRRLEVRFDDLCVRGAKRIEFRCASRFCNVNWWQWVSEVEDAAPPRPFTVDGRSLDTYQGW